MVFAIEVMIDEGFFGSFFEFEHAAGTQFFLEGGDDLQFEDVQNVGLVYFKVG